MSLKSYPRAEGLLSFACNLGYSDTQSLHWTSTYTCRELCSQQFQYRLRNFIPRMDLEPAGLQIQWDLNFTAFCIDRQKKGDNELRSGKVFLSNKKITFSHLNSSQAPISSIDKVLPILDTHDLIFLHFVKHHLIDDFLRWSDHLIQTHIQLHLSEFGCLLFDLFNEDQMLHQIVFVGKGNAFNVNQYLINWNILLGSHF